MCCVPFIRKKQTESRDELIACTNRTTVVLPAVEETVTVDDVSTVAVNRKGVSTVELMVESS